MRVAALGGRRIKGRRRNMLRGWGSARRYADRVAGRRIRDAAGSSTRWGSNSVTRQVGRGRPLSRGLSLRSPTFLVVIGAVVGVFAAAVFIPAHQPVKVTVGQAAQTPAAAAGAPRLDQVEASAGAADDTPTTAAPSGATVAAASAGPAAAGGGAAATPAGGATAAAAQPSSTATVRGVTDNAIKIGVSVFDVSAFK